MDTINVGLFSIFSVSPSTVGLPSFWPVVMKGLWEESSNDEGCS